MLHGLADLPAASIALLEQKRDKLIEQMQEILRAIEYANYRYHRVDHFGGKSPDEFAAYIGGLQAQQALKQSEADKIMLEIQQLSAAAANEAAAAAAAAASKPTFLTPAQTVTSIQEEADRLEKIGQALTGPRNDFGARSAERTAFYAEYSRPEDPGLGVDVWAAITAAAKAKGAEAFKGVSVKGLPGVKTPEALKGVKLPMPSWLSQIRVSAPNLSKLPAAVQEELRRQRQAEAAAQLPAASASSSSEAFPIVASPAVSWLGILVLAGGAVLAVKAVKAASE